MNPKVQQSYESEGYEEQSISYKNDFLQEKFQEVLEKHPDLSADQAFYLQYCKLYIETIKVESQVKQAMEEIEKLKGLAHKHPCKIRSSVSQHLHNDTSNSQRRKRIRRTANQIARHYICKVEKCQKSYGSEGSLNQHMKIKHRELFDFSTGMLLDK